MRVLGLETSCDETGLAIFDSEQRKNPNHGLVGQVLYSQIALHATYGGVVPELASRDHIRKLVPLLNELLEQCGLNKTDIDAIAYTKGPGLVGALMTGALFGRSLAFALGIPAIGVHHMEGHLLAPLLDSELTLDEPLIFDEPLILDEPLRLAGDLKAEKVNDKVAHKRLDFPFVALLVSGGHTMLVAVQGVGQYAILGESIDDAAGECFDKAAKMLNLPYPGGPNIAKLAQSGNPNAFDLPRPMIGRGLDFSFSGMKTAVHNLIKAHPSDATNPADAKLRADIAASFEFAVVDTLVKKCVKALQQTGLHRLVIAGGVSANQRLRQQLTQKLATLNASVHYAPAELCTDNGAMIAFAGWQRLRAGQSDDLSVSCLPRWDITTLPAVAEDLT